MPSVSWARVRLTPDPALPRWLQRLDCPMSGFRNAKTIGARRFPQLARANLRNAGISAARVSVPHDLSHLPSFRRADRLRCGRISALRWAGLSHVGPSSPSEIRLSGHGSLFGDLQRVEEWFGPPHGARRSGVANSFWLCLRCSLCRVERVRGFRQDTGFAQGFPPANTRSDPVTLEMLGITNTVRATHKYFVPQTSRGHQQSSKTKPSIQFATKPL